MTKLGNKSFKHLSAYYVEMPQDVMVDRNVVKFTLCHRRHYPPIVCLLKYWVFRLALATMPTPILGNIRTQVRGRQPED